jgi:hypothetical protein
VEDPQNRFQEDPHDVYRRQTGLLVMSAAFVFWLLIIAIAFATQASFFSMEEYLQQPMWTEGVPWLLNLLFSATALVIGLTRLALLVVGVAGVVLLSSRLRTHGLYKFSWIVYLAITANIVVYEILAVISYSLARQRLPNNYSRTVAVAYPCIVILAGIAALVWLSGRRMLRVSATTPSNL